MTRAGSCPAKLVITPKVGLITLVSGKPKLGWLKALKASARNCNLYFSPKMGKFLETPKSKFEKCGPRRVSRLPLVSPVMGEKAPTAAMGSEKNWTGPLESVWRLLLPEKGEPLKLTPWSAARLKELPPPTAVKASPVRQVIIPETCQPPMISLSQRGASRAINCLRPMGRS